MCRLLVCFTGEMKLKRLTLGEGFRVVRVIAGTGSALVKKKRYKLAEMNDAPRVVS